MHTPLYKRSLIVTAFVMALAVFVPFTTEALPAQAVEAQSQAQERQQPAQATDEMREQRADKMRTTNTERREAAKTRLEAAKLRACQNREKAIQNIMARIADRSTKQLDVFTKIADRTQAFYETKGNVVDNYGTLLADVATKKAVAEAIVADITASSSEFSCEGDDPKGYAAAFKTTLQARNEALKEYKTAVKNLIVGVKSAQSTATESTTEGAE